MIGPKVNSVPYYHKSHGNSARTHTTDTYNRAQKPLVKYNSTPNVLRRKCTIWTIPYS